MKAMACSRSGSPSTTSENFQPVFRTKRLQSDCIEQLNDRSPAGMPKGIGSPEREATDSALVAMTGPMVIEIWDCRSAPASDGTAFW
jgi:hypothetical protein